MYVSVLFPSLKEHHVWLSIRFALNCTVVFQFDLVWLFYVEITRKVFLKIRAIKKSQLFSNFFCLSKLFLQ